ncbi:MAG: thermonuclease family protein [Chloroflexota bacterium]
MKRIHAGIPALFPSLLVTLIVLFSTACTNDNIENVSQSELQRQYSCVAFSQEPQTGRVISVIDGDTIKIESNNYKINVRYIGINSPELDTEENQIAEQAREANRQLVENQMVTLYKDTSDTDRFGRLLRYVFVGDVFVNYEMVRLGYARQKDYPPDSACKDLFIEAQQEAIKNNRGMWNSN